MITKSFIKSSFLYTVGGALPMATGFILLPTYANNLGKEDYSFFIILQILFLFFQTIGILNIDVSTQSYYFDYKENKSELKKFVGTLVVNMLLIGGGLILLFAISGPFLFDVIFTDTAYDFYPYVFMAVIIGFCFSFYKAYSNFLIVRQRPGRFFILSFTNFALTVLLSVVLLKIFPDSLIGPVYGRLIPVVLVFLITFFLFYKDYGLSFNSKHSKDIIAYSLPSLLNVLIIFLLGNIDRLIISGQMQELDLIVYDTAFKIAMILEFILTGLTNSIYPKIMNLWADKKLHSSSLEENRYHNVFTLLCILLIAFINFVCPIVLPYLFKKNEYLLALNFIPLFALQFLFRGSYNLYLYPIYFFKRTKVLPRIFSLLAIIQISSSFVLIYYFGLIGGIASIILNKVIQIFLLKNESSKLFDYNLNRVKIVYLPLFYGFLIISGELIFREVNRILLYGTELIFILLVILWVYRSELKLFLQKQKILKI